jgi:hypothetical protein
MTLLIHRYRAFIVVPFTAWHGSKDSRGAQKLPNLYAVFRHIIIIWLNRRFGHGPMQMTDLRRVRLTHLSSTAVDDVKLHRSFILKQRCHQLPSVERVIVNYSVSS